MTKNTAFADKLQTAIKQGNFYENNYVWKGRKERNPDGTFSQESFRMMDCEEPQLRKFYNYCITMLYNQDKKTPGRRPLLDIVQSQKDRCGVELFLREEEARGNTRFTILESIKKSILASGITSDEAKSLVLSQFIEVPRQYEDLPIKLVQEGCLGRLGKFDKSHITLTFIVKQGLRIADQDEENELTEYVLDAKGNSVKRNYIQVVREKLNIADHMPLKMDSKGLTYTQLRAMMNLKSRYYNELNSHQLETLRYRILFSLEDDILFHIDMWEELIRQLREVATIKEFEL